MKRCGALIGAVNRARWSPFAKRNTSVASNVQFKANVADEKISRLPNGLVVASMDMGGPVSQLIFGFRAGSRYELADQTGLVHHLRNCFGNDSTNYYGAELIWQCGSSGMSVASAMTRDLLMLEASVFRDNAAVGLSLLGELVQPAFKPWNVEGFEHTIFVDRAHLEPYDLLMEEVHDAAFRNGPLGNRLYADDCSAGRFNHLDLERYAASRMVTGNAVIFGLNVPHDQIINYAKHQYTLKEGSGDSPKPSPYCGGEARCKSLMKHAHVAIVGEGASLNDSKGIAVQAVLSAALGQGSSMKFAFDAGQGVVANAVSKASSGHPFGLSTISEVYADTGLIGLYLVAEADRMGPLFDAAITALRTVEITDALLEKSKNIAAMNILLRAESSQNIAIDQATQIASIGKAGTVTDLIKNVASVTSPDVKKAIDLFKSRLTLASYGNIYQVPYLDNL